MKRLRQKLSHAFAVDPPGPTEPTVEEREAVDWFCRQVARRHLTTPGLIALEMSRPLNYLAAQLMHFSEPAVWALAPPRVRRGYQHFAAFLERRGSIDYLSRRIEHFEHEYEDLESRRRAGPRAEPDPEENR